MFVYYLYRKVSTGLTCEVHDGAAELELAGVVHLEPVGDQGVAEAPGHPSTVPGHLKMSPQFGTGQKVWPTLARTFNCHFGSMFANL